jgi:hypothetical protein
LLQVVAPAIVLRQHNTQHLSGHFTGSATRLNRISTADEHDVGHDEKRHHLVFGCSRLQGMA